MSRRKRFDHTVCPVCRVHYLSKKLRQPGDRCGDWSNGQPFPCEGRVITDTEYWHIEDDRYQAERIAERLARRG